MGRRKKGVLTAKDRIVALLQSTESMTQIEMAEAINYKLSSITNSIGELCRDGKIGPVGFKKSSKSNRNVLRYSLMDAKPLIKQ